MSRFEDFVKKSNEMHNNKYSYEKFQYINAITASTIICPVHGDFSQKPDHHTRKNAKGCLACVQEMKTKGFRERKKNDPDKYKPSIIKQEDLLALFVEKFGNKFLFDFLKYNGYTKNKIRIYCPDHGWFEKTPVNFMISSHGCTKCGLKSKTKSKTKPYSDFINKAIKMHNNKYSYLDSNEEVYINRKSIISIECKDHGIFKKTAQKHLCGQGCFKCKIEELFKSGKLRGLYSEGMFNSDKELANTDAVIYYLSINNGECFKVGITTNLPGRIRNIKSVGKNYIDNIEILNTRSDTLENVFYLEQNILHKFRLCRFALKYSTELLNKDISNTTLFKKTFKTQ